MMKSSSVRGNLMSWLFIAMGIAMQPHAQAADRYVAQDGQTPDPSGEYTTWAIAASNIQHAVDAADPGDTVWVRAETYTGTGDNVVSITQPLTLRSETGDPADVIIDGENARRGISVTLTTEGANFRIEGITITNGHFDGATTIGGGGIYLVHSTIASGTATVANCEIVGNVVTNRGYGGGMYSFGQVDTAFHTIVTKTRIAHNLHTVPGNQWVGFGGGLAAWRTRLSVVNCDITDNVDHGGRNASGGRSTGGGIFTRQLSAGSVIRDSRIERNTADHAISTTYGYGGGLGRFDCTNLLSILNCTIQSNTSYDGGGLNGSHLYVENCRIQYNQGRSGGGLYTGGDVEMRNCLVTHNTTTMAAGAWIHSTDPSVVLVDSCTIASNATSGTSNPVGGLRFLAGTSWLIRNTIVYTNYSSWSANRAQHYLNGSGVWSNSCSLDLPAGNGNIESNPEFVSVADADFRLQTNSPCIDTGTNVAWMVTARDLDGNHRLDLESGLVDMGAFEYTPPPPTGTAIMIR